MHHSIPPPQSYPIYSKVETVREYLKIRWISETLIDLNLECCLVYVKYKLVYPL